MMAQYRRIKGELPPEALLLFRLGDFYEMFFEDAQTGAQLLNVALTKRGQTPMCGIPFHAAGGYIARLLKAGRKVAICEQLEEARPGQLVKREVTQILSPGTHFDERLLVADRNNFLAAIYPRGKVFGLVLVDLTTSDFKATEVEGETALLAELDRLRPAEIIYPAGAAHLPALAQNSAAVFNPCEDWVFAPETALFTVREHFKVASLDGFGLRERAAAIGAAGAVLYYLTQQLRRNVSALTRLSFYQSADFMALDPAALRNLEVLEPMHRDAPRAASLYGAVNRTVTPMGARRLRDWLSSPLAAAGPIRAPARRGAALAGEQRGAGRFPPRPGRGARLGTDAGPPGRRLRQRARSGCLAPGAGKNPRPQTASSPTGRRAGGRAAGFFARVANGARRRPAATSPPSLIEELGAQLGEAPDLLETISRAIVDEPPLALKEGGLIRDGFDAGLDELRKAARGGKDWIAKLQQDEIERTGIASLKVRFNSVFGYYIEVTKSNLDKVPPHYVRKQTMANGERFITPELKEMEGKILGAEERAMKLEYELFQRVREQVLEQLPAIQRSAAAALAQLDVLAGRFAQTARLHGYCRPEIGDGGNPANPRGPPSGAGTKPVRGALRAQRRFAGPRRRSS
jgi:DNA mismatch repair protein MutS